MLNLPSIPGAHRVRVSAFLLVGALACLTIWLTPGLRAADSPSAAVARGKYIVEELGKCQDCHTPMTADGKLDSTKWLKGGELSFQPRNPVPGWHAKSPDLTPTGAVLQKRGAGLASFLMNGKWSDGDTADPPMPAYKMTAEDAQAVVAYLKSLR